MRITLKPKLRTALFWAITQQVVVIPCQRFGTTYRSQFQGSRILTESFSNVWTWRRFASPQRRTMCEFRLPPRSRWELRSSGLLRSEERQFLTDVAGQPLGPIFQAQASRMIVFLTLENGTDMLSLNVGKELQLLAAWYSRSARFSSISRQKHGIMQNRNRCPSYGCNFSSFKPFMKP
jgi:hypothetical protein